MSLSQITRYNTNLWLKKNVSVIKPCKNSQSGQNRWTDIHKWNILTRVVLVVVDKLMLEKNEALQMELFTLYIIYHPAVFFRMLRCNCFFSSFSKRAFKHLNKSSNYSRQRAISVIYWPCLLWNFLVPLYTEIWSRRYEMIQLKCVYKHSPCTIRLVMTFAS